MAFFSEYLSSILPTVSYADSEEEEEEVVEETSESEESEDSDESEDAGDDEEDEDEDDDDDDEEEQDPFDKLKEECSKTSECAGYVHHFQECTERVLKQQEEPGYEDLEHKEDCVEEFFHLQHCINDCAVPKLFYKLK